MTSDDKILDENKTIARALAIITSRLKKPGIAVNSPQVVRDYLTLHFAGLEHEVFTVLFLDVKNRIIAAEEMFRGTLTSASVYPREVAKAALSHNAASVIFAHNHPSGSTDPSQADLTLTQTLKQALALVDIRALDHIIVAGVGTYSFAEHGQI